MWLALTTALRGHLARPLRIEDVLPEQLCERHAPCGRTGLVLDDGRIRLCDQSLLRFVLRHFHQLAEGPGNLVWWRRGFAPDAIEAAAAAGTAPGEVALC